mgnify:CR=1 FL=1
MEQGWCKLIRRLGSAQNLRRWQVRVVRCKRRCFEQYLWTLLSLKPRNRLKKNKSDRCMKNFFEEYLLGKVKAHVTLDTLRLANVFKLRGPFNATFWPPETSSGLGEAVNRTIWRINQLRQANDANFGNSLGQLSMLDTAVEHALVVFWHPIPSTLELHQRHFGRIISLTHVLQAAGEQSKTKQIRPCDWFV